MINFSKSKTVIISSTVLGTLLIVGSFVSWWHWVYSSPQRTFQRMLETSLSTSSFSKSQVNTSEGIETKQMTVLQTSPTVIAKNTKSASREVSNTNIVTESVGLIDEEYIRYSSIKTDQKNENGEPSDFKSAVNVWSRTDSEETPDDEDGELALSSILDIIPVAQLSEKDRSELIDTINKKVVYDVDYSNVSEEIANGRPRYIYPVKLNLSPYVTALKQFSKNVNIKQLDSVDPSEYESSPPVEFRFGVDVWSGTLVSVESIQNASIQNYSSYGIQANIEAPTDAVPFSELQERLRSGN